MLNRVTPLFLLPQVPKLGRPDCTASMLDLYPDQLVQYSALNPQMKLFVLLKVVNVDLTSISMMTSPMVTPSSS